MPIDSTELDQMDDQTSAVPARERTNSHRILEFLSNNFDQAFRPIEVAEATGVEKTSTGIILERLRIRGLLRNKDIYYTVDPDALPRLQGMHLSMETVDKRFPREDKSEWDEYAIERPE